MAIEMLTDDAKAILLLCGTFQTGEASGPAPLNVAEYNQISEWLLQQGWRPSILLSGEGARALAASGLVAADRVSALLARGASLALSLEKWLNKGLWVTCRSDPTYPARLKAHLKRQAPPFLYGAGDPAFLEEGGLAVVGSRNVDAAGGAYAEEIAVRAGALGIPIISGGARGVDELAMQAALASGGRTAGVLSDGLLRAVLSGKYRDAVREGVAVLVSPYSPEAGFNVGMAMGRNKLIYALSDGALVVSADFEKGGTWAGAVEELRRAGGRPVFVRIEDGVPAGNAELLKRGAREFPRRDWPEILRPGFRPEPRLVMDVCEPAAPAGGKGPSFQPKPSLFEQSPPARPVAGETGPRPAAETPPAPSADPVYEAVLPLLLAALAAPKTAAELADELHVRRVQLDDWLARAAALGQIEKVGRSRKYIRKKRPQQGLLKLE